MDQQGYPTVPVSEPPQRKDGTLDVTRMSALVDQVAELRKAGVEVILLYLFERDDAVKTYLAG